MRKFIKMREYTIRISDIISISRSPYGYSTKEDELDDEIPAYCLETHGSSLYITKPEKEQIEKLLIKEYGEFIDINQTT